MCSQRRVLLLLLMLSPTPQGKCLATSVQESYKESYQLPEWIQH